MQTLIFNSINTVILALIPAVAGFLAIPVKNFIQSRHLEVFADRAVRYAEQALSDGTAGEQKYRVASQYLAKLATEKGIKVNPEDIKVLIEAAINSIKKEMMFYTNDASHTSEK